MTHSDKQKPVSGKITPMLAAKIRALNVEGKGASAIAAALGGKVTRQAIAHWLKGHQGEPVTAPAAPAERLPTELQAVVASAKAVDVFEHGTVDVGRRLRSITELIDRISPTVERGEAAPSLMAILVRLEIELAEALQSMIPPDPPDPEHDPVNIQAAQRMRAKLEVAIKSAEKDFRCASCGKSPYPKAG